MNVFKCLSVMSASRRLLRENLSHALLGCISGPFFHTNDLQILKVMSLFYERKLYVLLDSRLDMFYSSSFILSLKAFESLLGCVWDHLHNLGTEAANIHFH